jgi:hypothetical protein
MPRITCAVLMLCLLTGCSSKGLSEGTVKKELQPRLEKQMVFATVALGRIGSHCQREWEGKIEAADLTPDKDLDMVAAQAGGYITVVPDGPDYWRVSLTDKGKTAPDAEKYKIREYKSSLAGCDLKFHAIAVAHPEFARVVDIQRAQDAWNVSFTWKWAPTEFGRGLQKGGDIYSKLTPDQASHLSDRLGRRGMALPIPVTTDEIPMKAEFKMGTDGVWNVGSSSDE